jgi:hypothetical protein
MRLLHHTGKVPNITPLQNYLKKLKNNHADPHYKMDDVQHLSKHFTFVAAEPVMTRTKTWLTTTHNYSHWRRLRGSLK